MLIAEYSYEKDIEVKQKEAWQEGWQEAEERMILELQQKGFPPEQITELTEKKIEEARKSLLKKVLLRNKEPAKKWHRERCRFFLEKTGSEVGSYGCRNHL